MFLFQETYYVRPGLQSQVDQRVRSLHANHITNPASAAMDWMKYLGDSTTYLAFRLWHERNLSFDDAQRAWMAEYNRTRPQDAFTAPLDIEYFDQVDQAGESGRGFFLAKTEVQASGASTWGELETELKDRLFAKEQFSEYRLYRFMGGETRYFRAEFWRDRQAALDFWREEPMREFSARFNATLRRPPEVSHYEVLHQAGSAKPIPHIIVPET